MKRYTDEGIKRDSSQRDSLEQKEKAQKETKKDSIQHQLRYEQGHGS